MSESEAVALLLAAFDGATVITMPPAGTHGSHPTRTALQAVWGEPWCHSRDDLARVLLSWPSGRHIGKGERHRLMHALAAVDALEAKGMLSCRLLDVEGQRQWRYGPGR